MNILRQIAIIFSICLAGEAVSQLLPFPFPSAISAMLIMLAALASGILKVDHIKQKSDFLLSNMAFFFIPAGVGVMRYFDTVAPIWLPLLVIIIATTVIVFLTTALVVSLVLRLERGETE